MNLVPLESRGRRPLARFPALSRGRALLGGGLLLAGSLFAAVSEHRSLGRQLHLALEERDRLTREEAARERSVESIRQGRARIQELRAAERRLLRWDEERQLFPELLRGLAREVPEHVVLEELRREGPRVFLVGRTGAGSQAVAAAAGRFGRVDRLRELNLQWVEQIEDSPGGAAQRFSLAGSLRYNAQAPGPLPAVRRTAATGF